MDATRRSAQTFRSAPVLLGTPLPEGSEPEKSVVQIFTEFVQPNWAAPWIFDIPRRASGTGFLIDGNRIMTNAHVVAWTTQLIVRRYHDPKPYFAKVEFVAHDIDLAVIKVEDPSFYEGMKPLDFGPLPKVRSAVLTYGFPAGGQQISVTTRGVVSRIEVEGYVHISSATGPSSRCKPMPQSIPATAAARSSRTTRWSEWLLRE